ncbi:MAG: phosphotransferase [Candidatus Heimdallarchaeota archaeon]
MRMFPDNYPGYGVKNEYTIMDRLYKEGYPVPKVILFEEDKLILGISFLIMEFIESKVFYTYVINATPDKQEYWMKRFAELLVKLHRVDWKKIITDRAPKDLDDPYFSTDVYLNDYTQWRKFGLTQYNSTIDWLVKQRENYPVKRLGFNHRDFHLANILVAEDDSMFVVDWSTPNVSDIRNDIAHTFCVFVMEKQRKLGNLFLEYYEELSGEPIGDIAFYEVASVLQLLSFCIHSITRYEKDSEEYKKSLNAFRVRIENLYDLLVERTQIRIPEIEKMLLVDLKK